MSPVIALDRGKIKRIGNERGKREEWNCIITPNEEKPWALFGLNVHELRCSLSWWWSSIKAAAAKKE